MADPRKEYEIEVSGIKHTVLLLPEDAERYGKDAVEVKAAAPANKAATPANKYVAQIICKTSFLAPCG